jgi:hypothetical protein
MRTTISTIVVCFLAVVMNSHSQTQSNSPVGSFGFQLNNVIGVMNFDGAGNMAGTYTGLNGGGGGGAQSGIVTGTYSSNSNGIGSLNLAVDGGSNGNVTFSVVITDGGAGLFLLQTGGDNGGGNGGGNNGGNNNGGNNSTGIARRQ